MQHGLPEVISMSHVACLHACYEKIQFFLRLGIEVHQLLNKWAEQENAVWVMRNTKKQRMKR
jgi:hypothetical protein